MKNFQLRSILKYVSYYLAISFIWEQQNIIIVFFINLGKHITLVAHSKAVETSLEAAKELAGKGIDAEVINLRSLRPLDTETILKSVKKTNHLISVEQG